MAHFRSFEICHWLLRRFLSPPSSRVLSTLGKNRICAQHGGEKNDRPLFSEPRAVVRGNNNVLVRADLLVESKLRSALFVEMRSCRQSLRSECLMQTRGC